MPASISERDIQILLIHGTVLIRGIISKLEARQPLACFFLAQPSLPGRAFFLRLGCVPFGLN